ncbi:MAG: permease-like cell division protein FtsX [Paludibacteraceae bacterium]|nr:permease-like cell division protein FtsX [Paludibacteraceae bacterium]
MVLFLIGLECVLLLSTKSLIDTVKTQTAVDIVLKQYVDTASVRRMQTMLDAAAYCKDSRYISANEALEEHVRYLGEDPSKFLGYNPLSASFEMHVNAEYANPDSMRVIENRLTSLPYVDKVLYQRDLLTVLNHNINKLSLILLVVAGMLLLISLVLIGNTIRLQIYSKRFLINTMTLVGATSWMIKAPILRKNMGVGLVAGLLALAAISFMVYYVQVHFGVLLFAPTWQNIAFVAAVVILTGLVITLFASLFATGRYIRMRTDTMYEI